MGHRVDTVPWVWRPIWLACSWLAGVGLWLLAGLINHTCRWRELGQEALGEQRGVIYALWHQHWWLWVPHPRARRHQAWLQHPAAYMKPAHVGLRLGGIAVLLGSSGEEGRAAVRQLAGLLREGWSTSISPDGPGGPPGVLKPGVLHLALESGVPVVAVRLRATWALRLPSWDRKSLPLPFSRITIEYQRPVRVTAQTFEEAGRAVAAGLGDLCAR